MAYKNMVSVRVCGKTMTLSGNESVEYITKVANYIEEKAEELRNSESSKTLSPNLVSVLTSINIADDYFKEITKNQNLMAELEDAKKEIPTEPVVAKTVADNLRALLDGIKAESAKLKEDNQKLRAELEKVTKENEELIEKFKNSEVSVIDLKDEMKRKVAVIDQLSVLVQNRPFINKEEKVPESAEQQVEPSENYDKQESLAAESEQEQGKNSGKNMDTEKEMHIDESLSEDVSEVEKLGKTETQKQYSKKDKKKHHKYPHRR